MSSQRFMELIEEDISMDAHKFENLMKENGYKVVRCGVSRNGNIAYSLEEIPILDDDRVKGVFLSYNNVSIFSICIELNPPYCHNGVQEDYDIYNFYKCDDGWGNVVKKIGRYNYLWEVESSVRGLFETLNKLNRSDYYIKG